MLYFYVLGGSILIVMGLIYMAILSVRNKEAENILLYDESIISGNPDEHMKNLAYNHNAGLRQKCSRQLFKYNGRCLKSLRKIHFFLRDIPEKFISLVPASKWLIDNYYVIDREVRVIRESFNLKYCKRIPVIKEGLLKGYPRIYSIARELLKITDFHCDEQDIVRYLNEYQTVKPLTVAELWAFPNVLKLNLIENICVIARDVADSVAIKQKVEKIIEEIISKNTLPMEDFIGKLTQKLSKEELSNPNYIAHILYQLKELDIDDQPFREWVSKRHGRGDGDISDIIRIESQHQAAMQVRISSAFISLIEISAMDWESVFEKVSVIESILSGDPSGIYSQMNFATRDLYHHEVELLSSEIDAEEVEVARKALELARLNHDEGKKDISAHVGYYLMGRGKKELKRGLAYSPGPVGRIRDTLKEHRGILYFPSVFLLAGLIVCLITMYTLAKVARPGIWTWIFFFFCVGVISFTLSIEINNYLFTRFVRTRKLPSMDFEKGIPDSFRTVVVMPVIIGSEKQVDKYVDSLEKYYHVNKDPNIYFALLGDFKDARQRELPEDNAILEYAKEKINRLNKKYGEGESRFMFLCRYRQWNDKQKCWMGWERKRGKLEEFNKLILNQGHTSYNTFVGDRDILRTFKFVITIDADTELTKDSAARLIGIMAHPLNRPVLNEKGNRVVEGYTLLQPRIGVRMHAAMSSMFSKIFSGQVGINPYINAVSDVYQDNFREGIFAGKGIYDVHCFHRILGGKLPENAVLSHDLLEGSYVRCALATDVELMDGYPSTVISFFKREHRWIRGDWQLLPWIFGKDSLGILSRWKMMDNLRRSLIPVAQLGLVFLAAVNLDWNAVALAVLLFSSMLFTLVINMSDSIALRLKKYKTAGFIINALEGLEITLIQGLLLFIFIPYRAYVAADAVIRTLYRLFISHRNLLEWQTAEASEGQVENKPAFYFKTMWAGPFSGLLLFLAAYKHVLFEKGITENPGLLIVAAAVSLFWIVSPFIAYSISKPLRTKRERLHPHEEEDLKVMARRTWRYFEEFFSEKDNWLTPDNYQVIPGGVLAHRTSPTNIGFQLLSVLSARDLGFISISEMYDRLRKTFGTLDKMQRWNGHFYNWYNTRNLDLLYPNYVSTVDSGNFLAYLIVLKHGLEDVKKAPILSEIQFQGLKITAKLANIDFEWNCPETAEEWREILDQIISACKEEPREWMNKEWIALLHQMCLGLEQDLELILQSGLKAPSLEDLENLHDKAREILDGLNEIQSRIEEMVKEMDFRPLYDEKRNLFRVGWNVSANSPDNSYYDLLASEARLTSFTAIAKGDVPLKHWFKLGRPLTLVNGVSVLLSWSGTMFEYLLPDLILKRIRNTILDQSSRSAVIKQIEYARKRGVPWGISESGYYRFDMNLNYQYRAFGVPELGFRSDLRKSMVISPYSTMLALPIFPKKAYKNLKYLENVGALGKYGFYEALDFLSPRAGKTGVKDKFKLIQSFMVHHQGMSLVSMNNYLNGDIMQDRFHREPMVRGLEVILEEIRPYGIIIRKENEKITSFRPVLYVKKGYEPRRVHTVRPKYPVAHVLSNNRYTCMLTSGGSSYSTWTDIAVNRWKPSVSKEHYGMFFYIRDTITKTFWSATYLPAMKEPDKYSVSFAPDKAEYHRVDGHIDTKMEVTVSPRDDVEVRRITITNRGTNVAKLEVTSYFEPVLDKLEADLAHPAFSKLFVLTEYVDEGNILLATRRPRTDKSKKVYLFNTVAVKGRNSGSIEFETDRSKFLGRGNTLKNPHAMQTDLPLSNTSGCVLDPVMSLRVNVTILPGRSAVITYINGVAPTREKAIELARQLKKDYAVDDIFKMALFDSEVEMNYLGLTAKQVNAIQDLVGSIYYPSRLMRGPADVIEKNKLGQPGLWKFGISGDIPIMLLRISDESQLTSLRDVVSAYEYMKKNGMKLDFVILNEEKSDYFQPLQQKISDTISNRKIYYPNNTHDGRIYLLKSRQMTEEEINLLLTVSRIVLSDRNRLLSRRVRKQLVEEIKVPALPLTTKPIRRYMPIPLDEEQLLFFNGIGGFTFNGDEYVIQMAENQQTPAPWSNVISNEHFGCIVTNSGGGFTWHINSRENKLTSWSNDPVTDPPSEIVYIRDDDTGEYFTITPLPVRDREPYRIRHGMGYTVFEHNCYGLKQRMTIFVSEKDPVKVYRIEIENASGYHRNLSLYFYAELVMGVSREMTAPYIVTQMNKEDNVFTARNVYNTEFAGQVAFVSSSEAITSYSGDNTEFMGRGTYQEQPFGLMNAELCNKTGAALEPCAAVKVSTELKQGEKKEIIFIIGECGDYETALALARTYTGKKAAEESLSKVREYWSNVTGQLKINTPDAAFNLMMNGWLLYQIISCRIQARTAFYQNGGAYGFRDQLQDTLALLHSRSDITRQQILRCASRQFKEGDVQHWWHHDSGKGVRTRITDDLLWLPYTTAVYIRATGDLSILHEEVNFIEGEELSPEEKEKYTIPKISEEKASVYHHCLRAIARALKFGEHGLPLMGAGDWNDGMNSVGDEGKGESVWLAWFLYKVLKDFAPVCRMMGEPDKAEMFEKTAEGIVENVEQHAWDGEWYIRAFFDNGEPLGSRQNDECRIDSVSQTWSVLSGGGDRERAHKAMDSLYKYLVREEDRLIMLLTPPFDKSKPDPGYIKGYLPGVRENGGQYTHAAVWAIMAFASLGMKEVAYRLYNMINPVTHAQNFADTMKYKQEPYVVCADVYSTYPHAGRGGWSWYTGSASWMYQAGVEYILGIRREKDMLYLKPVIPQEWKNFSFTYRYGGTRYIVDVFNPKGEGAQEVEIIIDGRKLQGNGIKMTDDGADHFVMVTLN